jgi:hypothetical protein
MAIDGETIVDYSNSISAKKSCQFTIPRRYCQFAGCSFLYSRHLIHSPSTYVSKYSTWVPFTITSNLNRPGVLASMAGSTILNVVYGTDVGSGGADYFSIVEKAVHILSDIANAGAYLGMFINVYNRIELKISA